MTLGVTSGRQLMRNGVIANDNISAHNSYSKVRTFRLVYTARTPNTQATKSHCGLPTPLNPAISHFTAYLLLLNLHYFLHQFRFIKKKQKHEKKKYTMLYLLGESSFQAEETLLLVLPVHISILIRQMILNALC